MILPAVQPQKAICVVLVFAVSGQAPLCHHKSRPGFEGQLRMLVTQELAGRSGSLDLKPSRVVHTLLHPLRSHLQKADVSSEALAQEQTCQHW